MLQKKNLTKKVSENKINLEDRKTNKILSDLKIDFSAGYAERINEKPTKKVGLTSQTEAVKTSIQKKDFKHV